MADTKDWTWVLERPCPECGFAAGALARTDIGATAREVADRFGVFLAADDVRTRPDPDTWSALEYGCHIRDVYRIMRFRLGLMLDEHEPTFPNWDQDATVVEERYNEQSPEVVSAELVADAAALADAFDTVADWSRPGRRSDGVSFTIETFAKYFIHDPIHHLWDVTKAG